MEWYFQYSRVASLKSPTYLFSLHDLLANLIHSQQGWQYLEVLTASSNIYCGPHSNPHFRLNHTDQYLYSLSKLLQTWLQLFDWTQGLVIHECYLQEPVHIFKLLLQDAKLAGLRTQIHSWPTATESLPWQSMLPILPSCVCCSWKEQFHK